MMVEIYLIYGTLYDTDGTTPIANATVRGRNESTSNTISTTTDANGNYILDFGNITGGWSDGDILTAYVIYTNYEDTESVTTGISVGYSTNKDLTLVEVADNTSIDYCTVQDVYDELDGKTSSDISTDRIIRAIQRAEGLIDLKTDTSFKSITVTDEVHTGDRYTLETSTDAIDTYASMTTLRRDPGVSAVNNRVRTNYGPIISVSSLSINQAGYNASDDWSELTQQTGSGGDYIIEDADAGIIDFITT